MTRLASRKSAWPRKADAGASVAMLPAGSSPASEMPPLIGTQRWTSDGLAFTTSGDVISA